jgi:hypothetical protein
MYEHRSQALSTRQDPFGPRFKKVLRLNRARDLKRPEIVLGLDVYRSSPKDKPVAEQIELFCCPSRWKVLGYFARNFKLETANKPRIILE